MQWHDAMLVCLIPIAIGIWWYYHTIKADRENDDSK